MWSGVLVKISRVEINRILYDGHLSFKIKQFLIYYYISLCFDIILQFIQIFLNVCLFLIHIQIFFRTIDPEILCLVRTNSYSRENVYSLIPWNAAYKNITKLGIILSAGMNYILNKFCVFIVPTVGHYSVFLRNSAQLWTHIIQLLFTALASFSANYFISLILTKIFLIYSTRCYHK